jgi:hypothetical protein
LPLPIGSPYVSIVPLFRSGFGTFKKAAKQYLIKKNLSMLIRFPLGLSPWCQMLPAGVVLPEGLQRSAL